MSDNCYGVDRLGIRGGAGLRSCEAMLFHEKVYFAPITGNNL
jgi:hypothetical protein